MPVAGGTGLGTTADVVSVDCIEDARRALANDRYDLAVLGRVGLSAAPANAVEEVDIVPGPVGPGINPGDVPATLVVVKSAKVIGG